MQRMLILGAVSLLAGTAGGQWLEQSVGLRDTLTDIAECNVFLFNPTNHHAYIGGLENENLHVFDYATRTKVKAFDQFDGVGAMFLCPDRNRVYVLNPYGGLLGMLDATTDSLLGLNDSLGNPSVGAYNPTNHHAYVGLYDEVAMWVFDPGPDTVLRRIELMDEVYRMIFDSAANRLFLQGVDGSNRAITLIDCGGDSVAGHLPTAPGTCFDLAFDPAGHRLYSLGWNITSELVELWVYSTDSLVVIDTIAFPESWNSIDYPQMALNTGLGRLYVAAGYEVQRDDPNDTLAVIDLATNSFSSFIAMPEEAEIRGMSVNPFDHKTYVFTWDWPGLVVLGAPDSITNTIDLDCVSGAGWNPYTDEVLVPDADDYLNVLAGSNDSVLASIGYRGFWATNLTWIPAGNRLYAAGSNGLVVVGQSNQVIRRIDTRRNTTYFGPAWYSELNRLYFPTYYDSLSVFDCNTDSFLYRRYLRGYPYSGFFRVPGRPRLYCPKYTGESVRVYDVYSDSVIRSVELTGTAFRYNQRVDRVYGFSPGYGYGLVAIDPNSDSLAARISDGYVTDAAVNTTDNEVWFLAGLGGYLLEVADAATNVVVDSLELPGNALVLAWYARGNKLYAVAESAIYIVDCQSRQLIRTITPSVGYVAQAIFAERNDKLWLSGDDGTVVVNCRTDELCAGFPQRSLANLAYNPIDNRVYLTDQYTLFVFRDDPVAIAEAPSAEPLPVHLELKSLSNPVLGPVRFSCALPGQAATLGLYDATGRRIWSTTVEGPGRCHITWDRTDTRGRTAPAGLYFARLESGSERSVIKLVAR